jgi:hypothetical protein
VVLRHRQELEGMPICCRHHRDLLAFEKRLDDHRAPGLTQVPFLQHCLSCAHSLGSGGADDGSFTRCETGSLDY